MPRLPSLYSQLPLLPQWWRIHPLKRTDPQFDVLTLQGTHLMAVRLWQAIKVALSGDEAAVDELTARAGSIEQNVEKAVGKRAKELEVRADALCERVHDLDRIESLLSARLPDGSALDLIQVKR